MAFPNEISREEVFVVDPLRIAESRDEPRRPCVLWASPGSMFIDEVQEAWQRRSDIRDLADVSGPWAAALWSPSTGLMLATDPMGVQPLFWARTAEGRVAAASWLARLVDRPDIDDALDYEGILLDSQHLLWTDTTAHRTRFASVQRVPWGRVAVFGGTPEGRISRYWDPASLYEPDPTLTLDECAEMLRERVDSAIRRLLPAHGRGVGAHVSGGLDCTSVACRVQQILGEHGHALTGAYTWSPDEREVPRFPGDERSLLDDASHRLGMPITPIHADESGDWLVSLDQNRYPLSTHNRERWVLPMARRDGVAVMFSGWGGDEFASFNGRNVFTDLIRRGRWMAAWRLTKDRLHVTSGNEPSISRTARSLLGRMAHVVPLPLYELRHPRSSLSTLMYRANVTARLRSAYPAAARGFRRQHELYKAVHNHHQHQLALLFNGHLQHRTTSWYQTGRLFDIDYRYPLLDKSVVEAALRMPWYAFLDHGWDRIAYRLAVEPWVPPSIAWNVTKHEPAHMWPPHRNPIQRSTPEPAPWNPDDPEYDKVIEFGNMLRPPTRNRIPASTRVVSRPELAVGKKKSEN